MLHDIICPYAAEYYCTRKIFRSIRFFALSRRAGSYFYPAAQHFGIRIRSAAEKIFIERANGEYCGIHSRHDGGKSYEFVAAEVQFNVDAAVAAAFDGLFYAVYSGARFYHNDIIIARFCQIHATDEMPGIKISARELF